MSVILQKQNTQCKFCLPYTAFSLITKSQIWGRTDSSPVPGRSILLVQANHGSLIPTIGWVTYNWHTTNEAKSSAGLGKSCSSLRKYDTQKEMILSSDFHVMQQPSFKMKDEAIKTKLPHQEWDPREVERTWVLTDIVGPIQEPNSLHIFCHIIKILQVKNHRKMEVLFNSNGTLQFIYFTWRIIIALWSFLSCISMNRPQVYNF